MERKQIHLGYFRGRVVNASANMYAYEDLEEVAQFSVGVGAEGHSGTITIYAKADDLRGLAAVAIQAAEAMEMAKEAEGR
jgi:N-acetyl-gamma-glutamylphosphate reductase